MKPLLNKNQLEYGDNAKCIFLEGNELYMIARGDEHHYFTSLYRAGLYMGKQRAQAEYALLKGKDVNGWKVYKVDGSKIMWENIDEKLN